MKCYGQPEPPPDVNPTVGRSSSLAFYKKAVSYFMPNRLLQWNVQSADENPTKSGAVNDLIRTVTYKEVRKQGKPCMA